MASIEKIVVKMGGKEVALSPKEARELHDILADLMGVPEKTIVERDHYMYPWKPYYPYSYWVANTIPAASGVSYTISNTSTVVE